MQSEKFVIFPWDISFETGIEVIDKQHQKLVSILNELANTLVNDKEAEMESVFANLVDYANYHFSTEERIWSKYFNDDWLDNHCSTHASFLPKVLEIKSQLSVRPWHEVLEELIQYLLRWLALHMLDDDKRMSFVVHELENGNNLSDAKKLAEQHMTNVTRNLIDSVLGMYDGLSSHAIELIREKKKRLIVENELRLANKKLEQLSVTDELSGLFNRRYFKELIPNEIQRALRSKSVISFIALDLDHFKSVNDQFGHSKGDEAIVLVSTVITKLCRRAGDFAFRMGGEEFLIVVTDSTKGKSLELAEKIRQEIETISITCDSVNTVHRLTTSIGVTSCVPSIGNTAEYYLEKADLALYKAKQSGRNRVASDSD